MEWSKCDHVRMYVCTGKGINVIISCGANCALANPGMHNPIVKYQCPRSMFKHGCKLNVTRCLDKSNQILPCSILVRSRVWHWDWMRGQHRVIIGIFTTVMLWLLKSQLCLICGHTLIHCCADGKRQITSLFKGLPFAGLNSLVQMDMEWELWPGTLVTGCSLTHRLQGGTTCQGLEPEGAALVI